MPYSSFEREVVIHYTYASRIGSSIRLCRVRQGYPFLSAPGPPNHQFSRHTPTYHFLFNERHTITKVRRLTPLHSARSDQLHRHVIKCDRTCHTRRLLPILKPPHRNPLPDLEIRSAGSASCQIPISRRFSRRYGSRQEEGSRCKSRRAREVCVPRGKTSIRRDLLETSITGLGLWERTSVRRYVI